MYVFLKGSFGIVYEVKNRETLEKFAIKIINKEKVSKFSFKKNFAVNQQQQQKV